MNQLNITFNPVEDRLLLRMTARMDDSLAEYRIWLTRRFVRLLWPILYQMLEVEALQDARISYDARKTLIQFQQEAALSQINFSKPYSSDGALTPLGVEPLLVSRIQVLKGPEGNQLLCLQTEKSQGVNVTMNSHFIHSFRKLIVDGVATAEWDLGLSLTTESSPPDAKAPHRIN